MSGRTKAPLRASAVMPRPKSQRMYLTRTRPMMRERKVEAIRTRVALKAVWAWDGRKAPSARAQRVGSVDGEWFTGNDFTGTGNREQGSGVRGQGSGDRGQGSGVRTGKAS